VEELPDGGLRQSLQDLEGGGKRDLGMGGQRQLDLRIGLPAGIAGDVLQGRGKDVRARDEGTDLCGKQGGIPGQGLQHGPLGVLAQVFALADPGPHRKRDLVGERDFLESLPDLGRGRPLPERLQRPRVVPFEDSGDEGLQRLVLARVQVDELEGDPPAGLPLRRELADGNGGDSNLQGAGRRFEGKIGLAPRGFGEVADEKDARPAEVVRRTRNIS
jgi:hypothetical protein